MMVFQHRDVAHALPEAAAIALAAGLLHQVAVGILDVLLRRLALVPVIPLVGAEKFLRGLGHGAVVALLGDEAALPTRVVPVEVF